MRDFLFGIVGIICGASIACLAWLLWPLPDAGFDWQVIADDLSASGECTEFGSLLSSVVGADAEGVATYLDEATLVERCPALQQPRMNAMLEQISEIVSEEIDYQRGHPANRNSYAYGLPTAIDFWLYDRKQEASVIGFHALVRELRCSWQLDYGPNAEWYHARGTVNWLQIEDLQIDDWENRIEWCRRFAPDDDEIIWVH